MGIWTTIKSNGAPGQVRYRKHKTRKYGAVPDRYYRIRYWRNGKRHDDAIGWASNGVTPNRCFEILSELHNNYKTGTGPTTLAEKRKIAEERKAAEQKAQVAARKHTFKAFFYDVFYPNMKTRVTAGSHQKTEIHVRLWIDPVTKDTPFDEIGLEHVEKIRNNLAKAGRSPRTQQYVFHSFSTIWTSAYEHGLTNKMCPTKASSFRTPKVNNARMRFLTEHEEDILMPALAKKDLKAYQMSVVSLYCGLRWREVAVLKGFCIDLENSKIAVLDPKNKVDRIVPMPEIVTDLFESMRPFGPDQLLFPNANGQIAKEPIWPIRQAFRESGLNDGISDRKMTASFHSFRHTYASRLVQRGVDLYRVQKLMGHSTITMTERYAKLVDTNLEEAVKVLNTAKSEPTVNVRNRSANGNVILFKKRARSKEEG